MSEPYIELFPAMERDATLGHAPNGDEVVRLTDCTGAKFEMYPWEVEALWEWLLEHSKELQK